MEFDSISQFKVAIKEYANLHGFGVKFKKNDNVRCRVICQDGCEWVAYVSKVGGSTTYSIKTYNEKHTCARFGGGKLTSSKWIAKKLIEPLKYTPNMSINAMIQKVSESYCVKNLVRRHIGQEGLQRKICKEIMWRNTINCGIMLMKVKGLSPVSKEAYDWLMQLDPRFWSKAHMLEYFRCNMVMNNILEAFNGKILEAREQPIVAMLECIKVYMMTRFAKNKKLGEKQKAKGQKVCPRPMNILDQEVLAYSKWTVVWGGGMKFEVQKYPLAFKVNLDEKSCSCRFWQLTGIPCRHAVATMFDRRLLPSDFVHPYCHVNTYTNCYALIVEPINGEDMWQQIGLPTVLPPKVRVLIGRPKKARRRENDEAPKPHKLKRTNTSLRCDMCGTFRHNKRECQNMTIPKLDPPPKKPKVMTSTKKKNTATSTSKQTQPSNTQQSHTQPPKTSNMHTQQSQTQAPTTAKGGFRPKLLIKSKGLQWKGKQAITQQQLQDVVKNASGKKTN
ncbi:hypothetical protein JHK82_025137 [Glycine max]|nr:hypothetical protein JHK82_025137 [Glycine max]